MLLEVKIFFKFLFVTKEQRDIFMMYSNILIVNQRFTAAFSVSASYFLFFSVCNFVAIRNCGD
jgi:hypothetical protein